MIDIAFFIVFVAVPLTLGYSTAHPAAALIPAASLVVSIASYALSRPSGTDEIDVLPGLWIVGSAASVALCLVAVAIGRRRRESCSL